MAPMTGIVSNRKKDHFVFPFGSLEYHVAPRIPSDRIIGVLLQVGRLSITIRLAASVSAPRVIGMKTAAGNAVVR